MNPNMTKVYLLNVPLENDYKNTLYFTSKESQKQFFESKIVKSYTDFSYQRKDSFIRVPSHFDELQNVNYVMYQNTAYSNKWFYAFITDIKYVDDGRTDIYIETDYIQTWFFDYTVKSSFVEREHVNNDTVGLHTFPEGIEHGDYIVNNVVHGRNVQSLCVIMGTTLNLNDLDPDDNNSYPALDGVGGGMVNGIYNGIKYYEFTSIPNLNKVLYQIAKKGQSDGVICMFMSPGRFYETVDIEGRAYREIKESYTAGIEEFKTTVLGGESINPPDKPTSLNGYTPNNKKLLTFPYCYLMASNNCGANAIYKYEYFSSTNCDFRYVGSVTPGFSIRLQPLNYNGQAINNEEGLNLGKLPICSWNTDVYTNWLTQNSINLSSSVLFTAYSIATPGNKFDDGVALYNLMQTMSEAQKYYLTPPQAEGNINNGDVTYSSSRNCISLYQMSIKKEYAKIIDKFFDMYGYKVNMVKVPNKAHRSRYWYTKTIDVNIDGAIPSKDMKVIKDCYNKGITFWRNANEIENYSLSNTIV